MLKAYVMLTHLHHLKVNCGLKTFVYFWPAKQTFQNCHDITMKIYTDLQTIHYTCAYQTFECVAFN